MQMSGQQLELPLCAACICPPLALLYPAATKSLCTRLRRASATNYTRVFRSAWWWTPQKDTGAARPVVLARICDGILAGTQRKLCHQESMRCGKLAGFCGPKDLLLAAKLPSLPAARTAMPPSGLVCKAPGHVQRLRHKLLLVHGGDCGLSLRLGGVLHHGVPLHEGPSAGPG